MQLDRPVEKVNRDTLLQSLPRHQCEGDSMTARIPAHLRELQINSISGIKFIKWDGEYRNARSKAIVVCEHNHEWSVKVDHLSRGLSGCPVCAARKRSISNRTPESERINQINGIDGIYFVRWESEYANSSSRAIVRCLVDGLEWAARVSKITRGESGCRECIRERRFGTRIPEHDRISQINSIPNITFLRWADCYIGSKSKAYYRCNKCSHQWKAGIMNLIGHGTGCPSCARYGYNKGKAGFLYFLRSECGEHVKVGITNNTEQRYRQLKKATPFCFYVVEVIHGDGSVIYDLENYFHGKYQSSGFTGFDGATEWLVFDDGIIKDAMREKAGYGLLTHHKV